MSAILWGGLPVIVFAAKQDLAGGGLHKSCDTVDHGRLAGAVGADDPENFSFVDLKADIVQSDDAAKRLGDAVDLQNGCVRHMSVHLSNW